MRTSNWTTAVGAALIAGAALVPTFTQAADRLSSVGLLGDFSTAVRQATKQPFAGAVAGAFWGYLQDALAQDRKELQVVEAGSKKEVKLYGTVEPHGARILVCATAKNAPTKAWEIGKTVKEVPMQGENCIQHVKTIVTKYDRMNIGFVTIPGNSKAGNTP